MALIEVSSAEALAEMLSSTSAVCVTFSAHWCGPCKASKPQLEQLAKEYESKMRMAIVYENDIGEAILQYNVRAFPTYVLFVQGKEQDRVQGVNLVAVKAMMDNAKVAPHWQETQGATLGGGENTALTPEQARLQRLARLGGNAPATSNDSTENEGEDDSNKPAAETSGEPMETEATPSANTTVGTEAEQSRDMEMTNGEDTESSAVTDPTANLDKEAITSLTESMGFSLLRAQKGLLYGNGGTIEGAVEWLMEHQDDADIDDPIPTSRVPLSAEEKAAKIAEIKDLLKTKRAEREEAEKVDETDREKSRRFMGKEMAKTREQMDMEQRKREALLRKKEKEDFKKERARLRAELAKDKAERQAHQGKLTSKLGVDGYHPDAVQYDVDSGDHPSPAQHQPKKPKFDAARIDEYISKVSQYRAGGDGGKCLKILATYIGNVADNPEEEKFKTINKENKAFKAKVKPFIGAKELLMAVGFQQPEGSPGTLVLVDDANYELLSATKAKLEAALIAYG